MTTPGLKEAVASTESEATARQRIACQRAGVAYPEAAGRTHGKQEPWNGHPVDVLFSDGIPWSFRVSPAALGWIVAAIGIGSAVAILYK